jgi:hypothetical protein
MAHYTYDDCSDAGVETLYPSPSESYIHLEFNRDLEKLDSPARPFNLELVTFARVISKRNDDKDIVDFSGPDDPYNPYNWSKAKKWSNGALLSAMTFVT